ncbi:MAG: NAD-dependent succinate-semialdehyde dehydrogenase [Nocardioides sp.]|uniref:NAD-dependent succinate-semialdehyde dehydrogenase n=1 Tax=Nocardioides sp. TaxID=35761 RepID=UPI0039E613C0
MAPSAIDDADTDAAIPSTRRSPMTTIEQPVTHPDVDVASRQYRTTNPATGEVLREFPRATDEEAEAMLTRADAAYRSWRATPVAERVMLFKALADLIDANADELARLTTTEMGKPLAQSRGEVTMASGMFRYYAEYGEELLADEEVSVPGFSRAITRREPVGVVLGIEPWNGPMYQAMRATAPNLMLGNTVLLKPSEISAGSTLFFDSLFTDAGFPEGVYQTALVSTDQVSTYIADPRIRAVTLTGSDRAGSAVGEQAGRHIKPVVLELGGSDAFVVLDSADVAKAAGVASACRLAIGGQVCISPKRMIVVDSVADEFIAAFTEVFGNQVVGDPFDPATTVGPLSSATAADHLQAQYQDALDKGATVLVPGGRVDGPGAFFTPAAITDITPQMRVYTEEAFGPLAMIYRVPDADAAVELANGSVYGLGGTVYGDPDEARAVAERLDTGGVGINRYLGAPLEIPFGGTKRSGVGRELGRSGMDQFANIKTYGIA